MQHIVVDGLGEEVRTDNESFSTLRSQTSTKSVQKPAIFDDHHTAGATIVLVAKQWDSIENESKVARPTIEVDSMHVPTHDHRGQDERAQRQQDDQRIFRLDERFFWEHGHHFRFILVILLLLLLLLLLLFLSNGFPDYPMVARHPQMAQQKCGHNEFDQFDFESPSFDIVDELPFIRIQLVTSKQLRFRSIQQSNYQLASKSDGPQLLKGIVK